MNFIDHILSLAPLVEAFTPVMAGLLATATAWLVFTWSTRRDERAKQSEREQRRMDEAEERERVRREAVEKTHRDLCSILVAVREEIEGVYAIYMAQFGNRLRKEAETHNLPSYIVGQEYFVVLNAAMVRLGEIEDVGLRQQMVGTHVHIRGFLDTLATHSDYTEKIYDMDKSGRPNIGGLLNDMRNDCIAYQTKMVHEQENLHTSIVLLSEKITAYVGKSRLTEGRFCEENASHV